MTAYKFRIYPKKEQIKKIDSIFNSSYRLYNAMLQQRIMAYELKEIYSLSLQDVARRIDKNFDSFFRRIEERKNGKKTKAGFPRFKSRNNYKSITYTQSGFK